MKRTIFFIIFGLAMCNFTFAQIQIGLAKLKEIKILVSSRDDVRRVFADQKFENNNLSDYLEWFNTSDAEYEFSYSEGKCRDEYSEGFDVPEWKVEFIQISLKKTVKLKDIKPYLTRFRTQLSDFRKEKMYVNVDNLYMYHNKDLGIGLKVNQENVQEIIFIVPKKYYSLLCDKKITKRLSSTNSFFTRPLKERRVTSGGPSFVGIIDLNLNQSAITADCLSLNLQENKVPDNIKIVDVLAISDDPENDDLLTYGYKVSGGKIIGTGSKVHWDLTGVRPGIYTITAAVDDGCGFCGASKTKTIAIKESPSCPKN